MRPPPLIPARPGCWAAPQAEHATRVRASVLSLTPCRHVDFVNVCPLISVLPHPSRLSPNITSSVNLPRSSIRIRAVFRRIPALLCLYLLLCHGMCPVAFSVGCELLEDKVCLFSLQLSRIRQLVNDSFMSILLAKCELLCSHLNHFCKRDRPPSLGPYPPFILCLLLTRSEYHGCHRSGPSHWSH